MKTRKCIVWVRWSSEGQTDGDSEERQKRCSEEYCKQNNIIIVDTVVDPARSVKTGPTKRFQKLLKELPPDCGIVCENMDRISRGDALESQTIVRDLVRSGRFVVTYSDNTLFDQTTIKDLSTRFRGYFAAEIAAEENAKRAERVVQARTKAIELIKAGKAARALGGTIPSWIKFDADKWALVPDRVKILHRIFNEYISGATFGKIACGLNDDSIPTFRKKKSPWRDSTIRKLLLNEAVIGVINIRGERIAGAIPPIISEDIFYRVQSLLKQNNVRRGNYAARNINNVFRRLIRCGECGGHWKIINQSLSGCAHYRIHKCGVKSTFKFKKAEHTLLFYTINAAKEAFLQKTNHHEEIVALKSQIVELEQRIDATLALMDDDSLPLDRIKERLQAQQNERQAAQKKLDQVKSHTINQNGSGAEIEALAQLLEDSLTNQETRKEISNRLPSVVKRIDVFHDSTKTPPWKFQITFTNDKTTVVYMKKEWMR